MRVAVTLAVLIGLSACDQANVPVSADLSAQAAALAARQNTRIGEDVETDYVIEETVVSGNTISQTLRVRDPLANSIRGTSQAELSDTLERRFRDNYCRDTGYRTFIDTGGEVELVFRDRINRLLVDVNINFC